MIKLNDVTYVYNEDEELSHTALNKINLTIEEASHIAVLGHNGCGKSTLAKHLNALLLPTSGQVVVDDLDTAIAENLYAVRQKVGMVFQNPDNQLVATTVIEDVAFGPENIGMPPQKIAERVEEALEIVGMGAFKDASPHHLSGGQKQRIAIAGVIAMRPDYIVFDEPTAMLDPQGRQQVVQTMMDLNRQEKIGIINITHYMEEAVLAERVIVMDQGQVVLDGTPRDVFTQVDLLRSLQLDVPPVTELAARLHREYPSIPTDVLTIDELVEVLCP